MFREFLGGGLILESNGDKWRHDRNALKPAFTFHRLGELASTTIDRAQILCDRIATAALPAGDAQSSPQSTVRGVVDLEHEFLNLTFDMACCIAYGPALLAGGLHGHGTHHLRLVLGGVHAFDGPGTAMTVALKKHLVAPCASHSGRSTTSSSTA